MKNEIQFDMEAAIQALREGKDLSGKDGVLTPLIKQLTEAAMKAELDAHLAASDEPNRKNGSTPKKVKSPVGEFELHYVQKVIYTTNAVEAVHRQFRKLTKTKGGFTNENSLLKLLYAGIMRATERWTHPVQNWNLALSQMTIHFGDRVISHGCHSRRLTRSFSHSL